ncbi:Cdc48-Npl4-Ufd1 complex component Npl4 [Schizosaccharomyces japonicus yFS275]|uniref:Nuclear protein localization protein 4 n=1 Tax=Schizosaccharomyces japonicus (strain yFS275 / FY16936) TaxID=402676 RepID=B6JZU4_SCHJY|nr:Cdc48-Npl4-Ufd1 complex component Npl4 [Schizosaccharomyces japonicus yFS275]EEB06094.2 Cdc48-Npl4-Ufd1 complex component Npl4 [Schizosaccharomyces japonicus yFS275]
MILRFSSKRGLFRVSVEPSDSVKRVIEKIQEFFGNSVPVKAIYLSKQPSKEKVPCTSFEGKTVGDAGFKHGDMYSVTVDEDVVQAAAPSTAKIETKNVERKDTISQNNTSAPTQVQQDDVDNELEKERGLIQRPRSVFCHHGDKGMCDYCSPLEAYDPKYLEEQKIKHLSFHAYLRKLNATTNKLNSSQSFIHPLEEPDYRVKKHCPSGHLPWPAGVCTKCQPSAITLTQQSFRMVDHVEFSSSQVINSFLDSWRQTGQQRIGYMYGRYQKYENVLLGIKAVVELIIDPAQVSESDGVTLQNPWDREAEVDKLAAACGLRRVGIIFTDLVDDGSGKGTVLCKRHAGSYFLSSLETYNSAYFQSQTPNPSKWSKSGHFGSKFVTCVLSGNEKGEIEVMAYQVSNTAVALLQADLIKPTVDPDRMMVCLEEPGRYVPDVMYSEVNEYGKAVSVNAKPAFPVSFLLVTLTHGFPENPRPMFKSTVSPLAANFDAGDETFRLRQLAKLFEPSALDNGSLSNFDVLLHIQQMGILDDTDMRVLASFASDPSHEHSAELNARPNWQTLLAILQSSL